VIIMFGSCYFLNKFLFDSMLNLSLLFKLSGLLLIITICKIIYLGMIFMLNVVTIEDLKRYIKK
jgi:hypothetical protein